jgi:hypothetical protein
MNCFMAVVFASGSADQMSDYRGGGHFLRRPRRIPSASLFWPLDCGLIAICRNVRPISITSPQIEGSAMAKFQLPDEIQQKLERAAHLRWVEPRDNPHKIHEIADERTALRAELTTMFGSLIQQLVNADILSADVPENASFFGATASINDVHIDDEFGIILDCVPSRE